MHHSTFTNDKQQAQETGNVQFNYKGLFTLPLAGVRREAVVAHNSLLLWDVHNKLGSPAMVVSTGHEQII